MGGTVATSGETADNQVDLALRPRQFLQYDKWRAKKAARMSQSQQGPSGWQVAGTQWFLRALHAEVPGMAAAVNRVKTLVSVRRT